MKKDFRYYLGLTLFVFSFIPPVILLLMPYFNLPLDKGGILALCLVAAAEASFWLAVILLGKPFMEKFKARLKSFLHLGREWLAKPAGRGRHRFGVALVILSFVPYYLTMGILFFASVPTNMLYLLAIFLIAGDAMLLSGFLVLGASFWDKLNKLFAWPGDETATPDSPTE